MDSVLQLPGCLGFLSEWLGVRLEPEWERVLLFEAVPSTLAYLHIQKWQVLVLPEALERSGLSSSLDLQKARKHWPLALQSKKLLQPAVSQYDVWVQRVRAFVREHNGKEKETFLLSALFQCHRPVSCTRMLSWTWQSSSTMEEKETALSKKEEDFQSTSKEETIPPCVSTPAPHRIECMSTRALPFHSYPERSYSPLPFRLDEECQ